jgi:hypothetical protein
MARKTIAAIKKVTRDSSVSMQAALSAASNGADCAQFQDTVLDLNAQALAMYKLAVLEAD